jgi:hypothetical protein
MAKFTDIFKDSNDLNEKTIVGFASFIVMTAFAVTDLVTGYLGKELIVNEFIYNSFMYITLGAFGIAEVGKMFSSKKQQPKEEPFEEELG